MYFVNLSQAWKHVNTHGGCIITVSCSSPIIDQQDLYLYTWLYDANGIEIAEVSPDTSYIDQLANHQHIPLIEDGASDLAQATRNTLLQYYQHIHHTHEEDIEF